MREHIHEHCFVSTKSARGDDYCLLIVKWPATAVHLVVYGLITHELLSQDPYAIKGELAVVS